MDRKPATCILLLITCAIVLSVSAHFFAYLPFDPLITQALQKEQGQVFVLAMRWVSVLGETWIEAILVGTVMTVFLVRCLFPEAVFVLVTASSVGLTSVLKVLIGRPRPPAFFRTRLTFSFPSTSTVFPAGTSSSTLSSLVLLPFSHGHFLTVVHGGSSLSSVRP